MTTFSIGNFVVGDNAKPFIIAEAGINHNGDINLAKKMVLAAKNAGADAVKFQTFCAEEFIQDRNLKFTYTSQGKTVTEPILDMFKRCEFSEEQWIEVISFCKEQDILFLSTPGNYSDLKFLIKQGLQAIKVGSDDFVNTPLIEKYSSYDKPLLLSCGMAKEEEIENSLESAGYYRGKEICLFLCTSEYPTPAEDVNLRKLCTIIKKYPNLIPGLSDHTRGSVAAIMAVAVGAKIFEKHFTLDHDLPGPDHWFSETPDTLKTWIDDIIEAHIMLGSYALEPTEREEIVRKRAHRSITTVTSIKQGECFTEENLCMRRPGTGLPGSVWKNVIGKKAKHDIDKGIQITFEDIE